MTAFFDFTVPSDAFPLGEALDVDAAAHLELARFVPVGEDLVPYVWAETDDADAVASQVFASPHVDAVSKLDGAAGRSLFRVTWENDADGLFSGLQRQDVMVQRAACTDGTWEFKLVAEDREAFQGFQSACRERGIGLTVTRLSNSAARDSALYGLTDKQREALHCAYESGYYDPRTPVELAELSDELQISQQAFGARLRRGTGALIENTIAVGGTV